MDLELFYVRNNSQRCVHFGPHWLSAKVPSCRNIWCGITENVDTFDSKFYHISATKRFWQYQWGIMVITELLVPYFLLISCKKQRYHKSHAVRVRTCVISNATKQVPRRDWHAWALSKLRFSNTYLTKVFSHGVWHTNQAITKWNMKVPQAKS